MSPYLIAFIAGLGLGGLLCAVGSSRGRSRGGSLGRERRLAAAARLRIDTLTAALGRRPGPGSVDFHRWAPLADLDPHPPSRGPAATDGDEAAPILTVENLRKSFGGLTAVNDVSFSVRRGSIHAIIGPNDAGKTTLFNVLTGLMPPDAGRVVFEGEEVTGMSPPQLVKRGMGRSFQQTTLFWALSTVDNVRLASAVARGATRKMYGGLASEFLDRSRALVSRIGLGEISETPASDLSHGDQRSLEIATVLAVNARLLLLDEPTAGLSPSETRHAVALIEKLVRERGLTLLFVEHDMDVVFGIADRITVMHRGSVIAEGPPEEISGNPAVRQAYFGDL